MSINFNLDTFYTPEEVAKKLKLSLTTVYNLIKGRQIPALQLGKSFRIAGSELSALWSKRSATIPQTAINFVELLKQAPFRSKIEDLILFGSCARGEAGEYSDIDMLLIHQGLTEKELEEILFLETEAMESTGYGDELSVLKKSMAQWEQLQKIEAAFYRIIVRDGISLWRK